VAKAAVAGRPNAILRYLRETVGELRKVNWPTRAQAINLTLIVIVVSTVMAIILGTADFLFTRLFALIFV
jgi:preprotein translocase subunit SecE